MNCKKDKLFLENFVLLVWMFTSEKVALPVNCSLYPIIAHYDNERSVIDKKKTCELIYIKLFD
jgi:hypothetical protein